MYVTSKLRKAYVHMHTHDYNVKVLESIDTINIPKNCPRTIHIFTDSRITLDLLQNAHNRSYLFAEIR
jgi:hypothetical protein